jgi:hypothetical protein
MKIKNLIFLTLTSVILSGLATIVFISVLDKEETTRLFDQDQVEVPETYSAASISKGTILLLLTVGVIGVLGVSRKRKNIVNPAHKNEINRALDRRHLNE